MDITTGLSADLAALSAALESDSWGDDALERALNALGANATSAVSSYLGMGVVIFVDGQRLSFTIGAVAAAATSLKIPLSALTGGLGGHLSLYAATPGSLVDLAADLGYSLGIAVLVADIDGELDLYFPTEVKGMDGLSGFSNVNRATGVLMAQGHTAETARTTLLRLATEADLDLHSTAMMVLEPARDDARTLARASDDVAK